MSKKYRSVPSLFGGTDHYDEDGNYVGSSIPGIFGGVDHYSSDGSHAGHSIDTILPGAMDHYNASGQHIGRSLDTMFDGKDHFLDNQGRVGTTYKGLFSDITSLEDDVGFFESGDPFNEEV